MKKKIRGKLNMVFVGLICTHWGTKALQGFVGGPKTLGKITPACVRC